MEHGIAKIDQMVFGYADGHRLLACSAELPSRETYELAGVSDIASGSSLAHGESYLTGWPLRASKRYALIRTWAAPEKSRPGCVWSHVLILRPEVMSSVPQLNALLPSFRRPSDSGLEAYLSPIMVETIQPPVEMDGDQRYLLRAMVSGYYASGEFRVPKRFDDRSVETCIMLLWSQQWPRLRNTFAFRTARQQRPNPNEARFGVSVSALRSEQTDTDVGSGWAEFASADAALGEVTQLRRFLWRYGSDTGTSRERFRDLVRLYLILEDTNWRSISGKLADAVFRKFGKRGDAALLKRDILGIGRPGRVRCPSLSPRDLPAFVASHPEAAELLADNFPAVIDIAEKGTFQRWLSFLADPTVTDAVRDRLEQAILWRATAADLADPLVPSSLLVRALTVRPELATVDSLATLDQPSRDALLRDPAARSLLGAIARDALATQPTDATRQLALAFPFEWQVEASRVLPEKALHREWRTHLVESVSSDDANRALATLDPSAFARWYEAVGNPDPHRFEIELARVASRLKQTDGNAFPLGANIASAFVVLACLDAPGPTGWDVLVRIFPTFREEILRGQIPAAVGEMLTRSLPDIHDQNWDLNLRLLIRLHDYVVEYPDAWPDLVDLGIDAEEAFWLFEDTAVEAVETPAFNWPPFKFWFG